MNTRACSILYIEDNPENRLLIRRVLESEGYIVSEASNAMEAIENIASSKPDLILMDINLPGMSGYTLTERLKAQPEFSRIPIIALTANVMKGDREKTIASGCDGYIQKPIDVDQLPIQIKEFILRGEA